MTAYYSVKSGRKPGIYKTWQECKDQVHGYSGAIYKKFDNKEEAENFIRGNSSAPRENQSNVDIRLAEAPEKASSEKSNLSDEVEKIIASLGEKEAICYVDGSFNSKENLVGYGLVLISRQGKETYSASSKDYTDHRNVSGEVMASCMSLKLAMKMGIKKISIYYDYAGIRHWALGEWKANIPLTKEYRSFFKSIEGKIEVDFVKVKAHTGVLFNEEVDKLAKRACGIDL